MKKLPNLFENNRQWAERMKQESPGFFKELSKDQNPEYLWLGCSDSRVPANQIVDLSPGDIFVHRNIANVVIHSDLNCQSVLQYAVEMLKVKHIIVCGHYGCGGVRAAYENQNLGLIDNWLRHLKDIFTDHHKEIDDLVSEEEKINKLCEINVRGQVKNVCYSPFVQKAWKQGQEISVHGWIYDLKNGQISDLDLCISSSEETEEVYSV